MHMLDLVTTTSAPTLPVWMVHLQVEAGGDDRPPFGDDVEPMIELMYRTEGVRSVAVVQLESGLAVTIGLAAADATTALERVRGLLISCARYAGLGAVTVLRARVTPAPDGGAA
jgi:hypothetical protein